MIDGVHLSWVSGVKITVGSGRGKLKDRLVTALPTINHLLPQCTEIYLNITKKMLSTYPSHCNDKTSTRTFPLYKSENFFTICNDRIVE